MGIPAAWPTGVPQARLREMTLRCLLVLAATSACLSAANAQPRLPPIEFDKQLGADAEAEILASPRDYPILLRKGNEPVYAYLEQLMERILKTGNVVHARDFDWTIHVIADRETINAFAMPGGYIYVYTGLIDYLDDEAELAGVVAHEIAHADRRHSTRQMARETLLRLLRRRRGGRSPRVLQQLIALRHGRSQESEADADAVAYVCATHYDAHSITGFFEKMSAEGGRERPEFLSTHPNHDNRVESIRAAIAKTECPGTRKNASAHERIEAMLPTALPSTPPSKRPERDAPPRQRPRPRPR